MRGFELFDAAANKTKKVAAKSAESKQERWQMSKTQCFTLGAKKCKCL